MAEILRPRSLGELFSQTFNLVFGNLPALIAIQAIFWLPVSVLNYLVGAALRDVSIQVDSSEGVELDQNLLIGGAYLAVNSVNFVTVLIIQPIMSAASMLVISDRFMGRRTSVGTAIGLALRRFASLITVGFVVSVCAGVCLIVGFGGLGASIIVGSLGVLVGLPFALASIVLSIRIQLMFSVTAPAVALENLGTGAALRRSRYLTAGRRMTIFLLMLMIGVVLIAMNIAMRLAIKFSGALALVQEQEIASWGVETLLSMVSSMIFCVAIVAVYFDLRVRKDGFDLDNLAELVDVIAHRAAIPYDRGIAPESSREDLPRDDDDDPISRDT